MTTQQQPQARPNSNARGYNSQWRRARQGFLSKHPLCRMCEAEGVLTPANVVDHIIPHKGDKTLFWDSSNWQPLCKRHHDSSKQIEERADQTNTVDANGFPTHPDHHWNDERWKE